MEKAVLIGIKLPSQSKQEINSSLEELAKLAETAGAKPIDIIIQSRENIDPALLIGSGKIKEIKELIDKKDIHTVIFDEELKPVQQKNLEEQLGAKIIDRTRLILDIFAQRARSKEGILQVERAQLEYYLPRLTKKGLWLDGQVGGIGTRGPGEKKLEVDQRRIKNRIVQLDREIESLKRKREILRQRRIESGQSIVALVGYTNSGKSTLLNLLSKTNAAYADDKLFATLDPTTRRVRLPKGRTVLFTDTVGFINKLPHSLIAAFRSTLEEVNSANCLIHVIDVSQADYSKKIDTVINVLNELNVGNIPILSVYNKIDLLPKNQIKTLQNKGYILISAKTGQGINKMLNILESIITPKLSLYKITIPYEKSKLINYIFNFTTIKKQEYTNKGIVLYIKTTPDYWLKIKHMIKNS